MQPESAAKKPVGSANTSSPGPHGEPLNAAQKMKEPSRENVTATKSRKRPVDKLATRSELYLALGVVLFYVAIYAAGRRYWDERYYIAEEGLGYFLGISGGIIMLLAMAYSFFKYAPSLRKKIKIKAWLNVHIIFGLLGPLLIYFHSTFRIGSFNGGIALVSMSLVLLSGIIGRYLYSKTHYGLGGQKARLGELHKMLNDENSHFHSERLNIFTKNVMKHSTTLLQATWELFSYWLHSRWIYYRVAREMTTKLQEFSAKNSLTRKEIRKHRRAIKKNLWNYLVLLHKVALFKLYERFFAFWRNAHVPLLFLMLFSGIVHVIAVHIYSA